MKKIDLDGYHNINDNYHVKQRLADVITELVELYNTDVLKFYSPKKVRAAGVRSRNKLRETKKTLNELVKDMVKQTQDYDSDYE